MVVAYAILVERRGSKWVEPPKQTFSDENAERVVDRLLGNGADLGAHDGSDFVRSRMWVARNRAQNGQSLRRDLHTPFAK